MLGKQGFCVHFLKQSLLCCCFMPAPACFYVLKIQTVRRYFAKKIFQAPSNLLGG
jgi:hypothetical protein